MFVKTTTRSGRVAFSFNNKSARINKNEKQMMNSNIATSNKENDSSKLNVSEISINKSQEKILNISAKGIENKEINTRRGRKRNNNIKSNTVLSERNKACINKSNTKQRELIKNRILSPSSVILNDTVVKKDIGILSDTEKKHCRTVANVSSVVLKNSPIKRDICKKDEHGLKKVRSTRSEISENPRCVLLKDPIVEKAVNKLKKTVMQRNNNNLESIEISKNQHQINENDQDTKMNMKKIKVTGRKIKKAAVVSPPINAGNDISTSLSKNRSKRKRIQKKLDYNEITLSTSQDSSNTSVVKKTDRVPIYQKKIEQKSPNKPKNDVYEFKEEVAKIDREEEFEDGMASLIAQLENRFNKKEKPKKSKALKSNIKKDTNKAKADKQNVAIKDLNNEQTNPSQITNMKKNVHVHFIQSTPIKNTCTNEKTDNLKFSGQIELIARRDSVGSDNIDVSSPLHDFPFNTPYHVINPSPVHENKSVQILSDILLGNADEIPTDDSINSNFRKPNANSTMNLPKSPWRAMLPVKRSSLFIKTKKSSLPVYDQEIVIDYKLAEKSISSPMKKIESPQLNSTKQTRQDTILNYINSTVVVEPENQFNYSLFDADQLSPVKNKTPLRDTTNCPLATKSSAVKNLSSLNDSFSFFGEENIPSVKSGKPARLSLNKIKSFVFENKSKKIKKRDINSDLNKNHAEVVDNLNDNDKLNEAEIDPNNEVNKTIEENVDDTNDMPVVGLFEEFTEKVPAKASYTRKFRSKRQRYLSCNQESADEDEVVHVKKRKKDIRNKEEELEAERLAEEYNKMFKEIENYELEVE